MDLLKSQSRLTGITLSDLFSQPLLPHKALQVTILTKLQQDIEMREILKAGVRLNDEGMFNTDKDLFL